MYRIYHQASWHTPSHSYASINQSIESRQESDQLNLSPLTCIISPTKYNEFSSQVDKL
jgi:hypothetical protein